MSIYKYQNRKNFLENYIESWKKAESSYLIFRLIQLFK